VCSALAHGGARYLDAPAAVSIASAPIAAVSPVSVPEAFAPSVASDTACARAPPASLALA
jgi:hypothetical protein